MEIIYSIAGYAVIGFALAWYGLLAFMAIGALLMIGKGIYWLFTSNKKD